MRENGKKCSAQSKNAREYCNRALTLCSENRSLRKNYKRYCLRLNHAMHALTGRYNIEQLLQEVSMQK